MKGALSLSLSLSLSLPPSLPPSTDAFPIFPLVFASELGAADVTHQDQDRKTFNRKYHSSEHNRT